MCTEKKVLLRIEKMDVTTASFKDNPVFNHLKSEEGAVETQKFERLRTIGKMDFRFKVSDSYIHINTHQSQI